METSEFFDRRKIIGIASDHGGFMLKTFLKNELVENGFEVIEFGNTELDPDDDFPDYVIPLAKAVSENRIFRGIAVCGSGVGACVATNKVKGVRACLINETFSAHQGVEDDNINLICLGGRVLGDSMAWEIVETFLHSEFIGAERHNRRLEKISALEQ